MNNYLEKGLFIIEKDYKQLIILPNDVKLIIHVIDQLKQYFIMKINTKQAHGAGLHGTTGTWGVGRGRQDRKLRTGGGGRRYGSLFGQAIQDWNKIGK